MCLAILWSFSFFSALHLNLDSLKTPILTRCPTLPPFFFACFQIVCSMILFFLHINVPTMRDAVISCSHLLSFFLVSPQVGRGFTVTRKTLYHLCRIRSFSFIPAVLRSVCSRQQPLPPSRMQGSKMPTCSQHHCRS